MLTSSVKNFWTWFYDSNMTTVFVLPDIQLVQTDSQSETCCKDASQLTSRINSTLKRSQARGQTCDLVWANYDHLLSNQACQSGSKMIWTISIGDRWIGNEIAEIILFFVIFIQKVANNYLVVTTEAWFNWPKQNIFIYFFLNNCT